MMRDSDLLLLRKKIFIRDQRKWDAQNVEIGITSADIWRSKFCGDCSHHKQATLSNSSGYTSCDVNGASVCFGMACDKGKWQPRSKV